MHIDLKSHQKNKRLTHNFEWAPQNKCCPQTDYDAILLVLTRCIASCVSVLFRTTYSAFWVVHDFHETCHSVTSHCTGQFTPKMKANAEPRLLSSLVWIDQYNECNGMTSFIEFMLVVWTIISVKDMNDSISKCSTPFSQTVKRKSTALLGAIKVPPCANRTLKGQPFHIWGRLWFCLIFFF